MFLPIRRDLFWNWQRQPTSQASGPDWYWYGNGIHKWMIVLPSGHRGLNYLHVVTALC